MSLDINLKLEDAKEIFSHHLEVVSKRGISDMFSAEKQNEFNEKIENKQYLPVHREALRIMCGTHIKRRVTDHFRKAKALKRGYGMVTHLDEHEFIQVADLHSLDPYTSCEMTELRYRFIHKAKKLLIPKNWNQFNERERIVINVAKRKGLTELKRSGIYKHLTSEERKAFLPKDGKPVIDEEKTIKTAIYKTIKGLPITAAHILTERQN